MNFPATISLLIVAKYNPESYRSLIDAAIGNVDEIVTAVDDGAEPGIYGYRDSNVAYHHRPLFTGGNPDFAAQQNFLALQAKSKWLLFLDTDENLTPWLWEKIKIIADSTVEDSISFPLRSKIVGRQDFLAWPDYHVRMYRPNGRIRWTRTQHSYLIEVLTTRTLPMELRYAIHHTKTVAMQDRSDEFNRQFPLK